MPCYRCGARQTDPVRGPSPWKRGVRSREQVLVCPDCQHGREWRADLDSCPACGSTALVRVFAQTACRGCGADDVDPVPARSAVGWSDAETPERRALAAEVAAAIDRTLGRAR